MGGGGRGMAHLQPGMVRQGVRGRCGSLVVGLEGTRGQWGEGEVGWGKRGWRDIKRADGGAKGGWRG